jgi:hypothetical protein
LRVGFPHSEIRGSKLVCQLPAAYRRLRRPSSPVIAKASTTCTCSLDPITLSPRPLESKLELQVNSCLPHSRPFVRSNATIQSLPITTHRFPRAMLHPRFATNRDLYFFRIVKEQLQPVDSWSRIVSADRINAHYRTRELMVEVNGIEPMTSCLQSRRSPN